MIRNLREQKKKRIVYFVFGAISFVLVTLYLVQINSISTLGYSMKKIEAQAQQLKEENRKLEMKVIEAQSIITLNDKVAMLGMVPVGDIKYLDGSSFAMAR